MKLRLLILLAAAALAAAPAAGQTIKSLGFNTTNGNIVAATNVTFTNSVGFATNARAATRTNLGGTTVGNAVFTATNAEAARTAISAAAADGFGVVSNAYKAGILVDFTDGAFGADALSYADGVWAVSNPTNFRTAIGLGATNNVTFSNITASGTLTATGNATLNGVGNTAPSQTASSGSSLMTRDLSDLRVFGQLALVQLVTPNMGTVYNTNGASGSPNVNGFDITTSTNSASSSFYSGLTANKQSLNGANANTGWNGRVVAGWVINRYDTNVEARMQLGRATGTQAHGPLTNRGIGIRVNGNNMFFEAHDGTTHFETTNAVTLTHGFGATDIFWAVAQSGVLRFYRGESTLLATVTNNVPTTTAAENDAWSISISNTSTVSSGFRVFINPGFVLQQ
jgi:hypothetical protein